MAKKRQHMCSSYCVRLMTSTRRRHWHPTSVFLPGKSHGWRSLVGCNPWGHKESDTTEQLHFHFSLSCIAEENGNPLQCSCLEKSHGQRSLVGCSPWVSKSWTRLSDFTFTFHFHALQKEMATHSSALAWRIPGTEEPGGLLSMESHRVGHDWSDLAAAAAAMTSTKAPSLWSEIFYGYFYSKELIVWIFLVPISRKGITSINWMSSKKKRTNTSITLNI